MRIKHFIAIIIALLGLLPCLAQKHQHGKASFYSKRATGTRSASGQKIHHDSLTCAHRSYPFGTLLKVTNLSNNKSVIVKVIDRGPYGRGRVIDLSWAAANKIGMISQGIATVKIEMAERPIPYRPEERKMPKLEFDLAEFEPQNGHNYLPHKIKEKQMEGKEHENKKEKGSAHDKVKQGSQLASNKNNVDKQEKKDIHSTEKKKIEHYKSDKIKSNEEQERDKVKSNDEHISDKHKKKDEHITKQQKNNKGKNQK